MFKPPEAPKKDLHTLICAINYGETSTTIEFLKQVREVDVERAFRGAVQVGTSSRILQFGDACRERLGSIIKAMHSYFSTGHLFEMVLTVAISERSIDFVEALLDARAVPRFGSSHSSMLALSVAAHWFQLDIFEKVLEISAPLSFEDAHNVLGVLLQYKGQSQLAITSAFVKYLDQRGTIREVVNYRPPASCQPFCDQEHDHFFYPTQFWNAVDEGAYEIAALLATYEDTEAAGLPTTLFHVIHDPKSDVLTQLNFLFNLGPEYSKFLCDPGRGLNALHAIVISSSEHHLPIFLSQLALTPAAKWSNKADFRSALKTILEWFSDMGEDINATDMTGSTALHLAAFQPSLDAVELLILYGADLRIINSRNHTAYDMTLSLAHYAAVQNMNRTEPGTASIGIMNERRPRETEEWRATARFIEVLCKILVLLSKPGSKWPSENVVGLVENSPQAGVVVRGFVPMATNVLFTECTESDADEVPLQAWAWLEQRNVGFRVNIRRIDEFTPEQLIFVGLETLNGRNGSICEMVQTSPYLYRSEIYPIRR